MSSAARRLRGSPTVLAALAFLILAIAYVFPAWLNPAHTYPGSGGDALMDMWFLGWPAHALGHGESLLQSAVINPPTGVNLLWGPAITPWGILMSPVVAAWGPVVAYNVAVTLALALDGFAVFLLARRCARAGAVPAFVAGAIFVFSPFITGHLLGQLHLAGCFMIALLLILVDELVVRRRYPASRVGALIGAACGLEFALSSELMLTTLIAAGAVVAVLAATHRSAVRSSAGHVLRGLAVAAAVALVLCGYPLWFQLFGPHAIPLNTVIGAPAARATDLANLVIPTKENLLSPTFLTGLTAAAVRDPEEWTGFLGVPVIALCGVAIWLDRRDSIMRVIAIATACMLVLSLGAHLHVGGQITPIPLPWLLVSRLPILSNVLTERMSVFVDLGVALMIAVFIERHVRRGHSRLRAGLAVVVAGASLLPVLPLGATAATAPALFTSATGHALLDGRTVLVLPYPAEEPIANPMLWQAEAGYSYSMVGGYIYIVGPDGTATVGGTGTAVTAESYNVSLNAVSPIPRTAAVRDTMLSDLRGRGVSLIVVGPFQSGSNSAAIQFATWLAGVAPEHELGVDVWRMPRAGS
ncbi:MAG TPA: hypothetical protein VIG86_12030 [Candidatus Dormibacteraeota bacterium]